MQYQEDELDAIKLLQDRGFINGTFDPKKHVLLSCDKNIVPQKPSLLSHLHIGVTIGKGDTKAPD